MVAMLETKVAFDKALKQSMKHLTVIDFTATWCGPCQNIAPKFKEFASVYRNAIFVKCDVDNCDETAAKFRVRCMPTFKIIKEGKQLGEVQGADPAALEAAIKKHCA